VRGRELRVLEAVSIKILVKSQTPVLITSLERKHSLDLSVLSLAVSQFPERSAI
jgi:hypothetical protein